MRLRQLGTSQSITFFIPPEVHHVIVGFRQKNKTEKLDSHDVICWLLDNACDGIEQLQPLYFSQGTDFCHQRDKYVSSIKQNELQTLQALYESKLKMKACELESSHPKVAAYVKELNRQRRGFQDTGRAVQGSALQEVEEERGVAFGIESVRQVKKPFQYDALTFPGLHRDLETFTHTGRLPVDSHSICHVFHLLSRTSLGRKYAVSPNASNSKLFVSAEFERTAKLYIDMAKDSFLRPVNWILWSAVKETAVVLIPEEAEHIIQMARARETSSDVYLITYASPVTRMLPFNNFTIFSMPKLPAGWEAPKWLKMEVGILAGHLYFEWDEHDDLCKFLAVGDNPELEVIDHEEDLEDGYMVENKGAAAVPHVADDTGVFSPRPLTFLQEWLAVRRYGQDFVHTPMGFITQGKHLQASHPFFCMTGPTAQAASTDGPVARIVDMPQQDGEDHAVGEDEGDIFFDAVDDMGANIGDGGDEGKEGVYDDSEYFVSESNESGSDYSE
ncbi:hypothetical protein B0H63DRAFT_491035 [Podospora didyma]|uniref:ubiquitinyl hydrolase 1 n=1 Tax=Podospora didyma TaxID=330526 RepID=A0AAE0P3B3_9PEZI|nr:hypothetical protein B0H63DRAFT_491035 [Podospora didyma]